MNSCLRSPEPIAHTVSSGGLPLRLWKYPVHQKRSQDIFHVLFLHGYYDTGRSFDDLISLLEPDIQSFSLDFRGHGQSAHAPPGASYHLLDHVKDVFYVIDHLKQQNINIDLLVGHSMGGSIALMLAGAVPKSTKGLMLLDNLGAPGENAKEQPARLESVLLGMLKKYSPHFCNSPEDAIAKLQTNNPHLTLKGAKRMAKHMLCPDPNREDRLLFTFDPRLRGPAPYRYSEETWIQFCARVQGSTWILRAENGYMPLDTVYQNRLQAFAQANLFTIPEAGHHLHVDVPQIVAQYIHQYRTEKTS